MKRLFLAFTLGISFSLFAQDDQQLLALYQQAEADEDIAEQFYEALEEKSVATLTSFPAAMKAVSCFFMAKHSGWLLSKLSYFNEGKETLEKAIERYPEDFVLRYIRLATQLRAPSVANYDKNLKEDRAFLEKNIEIVPESIFKQKAIALLSQELVEKETI